MALSVCRMDPAYEGRFGMLTETPAGYVCPHASAKRLECGGAVTYYNLVAQAKRGSPSSPRCAFMRNASIQSVHASLSSPCSALSDSATDSSRSEELPDSPARSTGVCGQAAHA